MDFFEYILILTSVIYALAVAQILAGVSRLAQSSTPIRSFLPHRIWVFNLFIFVFIIWWATWEFRNVSWTFPKYAYLLIAPTLLFFVCSLLTPLRVGTRDHDLETHFQRIHQPFFATLTLAVFTVIVDGNVLADESLWHNGRYGHIALLAASAWGYFTTSRRGHIAIATVFLVALFATTVIRLWIPR